MLFSHCQTFSIEKNVMGVPEMHAGFKVQGGLQIQMLLFSKFLTVCST